MYPFQFLGLGQGDDFAHLATTWSHWDHPADLLSNILLYMPFGFFGCAALPTWRWPLRAAAVLAAGTLLSTAMELAQFYDAGRDSTLGDVYANAIGTTAGIVGAVLLGFGRHWSWLRPFASDRAAAAVVLAWFGYRLYPYVPTTEWRKFAHALAALVREPLPDVQDCTRFLLAWLLIGSIVDRAYGLRRSFQVLVVLIAGEWLGRMIIVGEVLNLKDIIGSVAALGIWRWTPRWPTGRLRLVAVAMAVQVVAERLAPFRFAATPIRSFGWVPALSLMQGSIGVAMQAFCEKSFAYGGLIWLWWRAGLPLPAVTLAVAALLAGTGVAETWLPDRSAEITDAIMALIIGAGFGLLQPSAFLRQARAARCEPVDQCGWRRRDRQHIEQPGVQKGNE